MLITEFDQEWLEQVKEILSKPTPDTKNGQIEYENSSEWLTACLKNTRTR